MKRCKRSIRSFFTALFSVAAIMMLSIQPAVAVHDEGLFQLDGNAIDGGVFPPDDWETLCDPVAVPGGPCQNPGPGPGPDASANVFTGITPDGVSESIFTGGRKDIQDIDQWGWKDGSVPDKSNLTNAYAASYENGDLIVYFGADRFANAGDTFMGFWFFKDEVTLNPDGSFEGLHTLGDILVLVNFPQGANAVPLIQVVSWDPACIKEGNPAGCAAKNLRLEAGASGAGAICNGVGPGDDFCAITNTENGPNDPTPSPWPYTPKSGPANIFPFESFFEGGINLSEVFPQADACFSSFMAETRSSSSFTASLKDFVLDAFPLCSIDVTKECANPTLNADDTITYDITGTIINDGFGTVHNVNVSDVPAFDAGSLTIDGGAPPLASLAGQASVNYSATMTVPLIENGTMDTVTATANTRADGTGTDLEATAEDTCPPLQVNPMASVSKNCETIISIIDLVDPDQPGVVAEVDFMGEVCNTGDSRLDNVVVTDDKAGVVLGPISIDATDPDTCVMYSGSYVPTQALDAGGSPTDDPTEVVFKDTVEVTAQDIFGEDLTPKPTQMATCPLCP